MFCNATDALSVFKDSQVRSYITDHRLTTDMGLDPILSAIGTGVSVKNGGPGDRQRTTRVSTSWVHPLRNTRTLDLGRPSEVGLEPRHGEVDEGADLGDRQPSLGRHQMDGDRRRLGILQQESQSPAPHILDHLEQKNPDDSMAFNRRGNDGVDTVHDQPGLEIDGARSGAARGGQAGCRGTHPGSAGGPASR